MKNIVHIKDLKLHPIETSYHHETENCRYDSTHLRGCQADPKITIWISIRCGVFWGFIEPTIPLLV